MSVDSVVVPEHVARLKTERHRLPQLLDYPFHGRVICDREVNDLPAAVIQNNEHVEKREVGRDDREEVHGPGDVEVVAQERQPSR